MIKAMWRKIYKLGEWMIDTGMQLCDTAAIYITRSV